ncbi:TrmH family RNA methyltransferase [Treponema pedis]|uniref:RNA methyltransferase n=1 Tax=Treponema pedis str. T A4 TaxID=1291379 RepID=S6A7Z0_9SPIR|nr:RNA methyltransferase [Treponema pedis]AGT42919.1 RNA methyltransferase [Treponema pedis str. T A4]QSI03775.1 RNA methyltransferase [Treponema pedis]
MGKKFLKELPVCGFEAVKALGKYHPEKISRLFFAENRVKQFGGLCKYLAENKKLYRIVSDEELEKLSESVHHQGVTAMIFEPIIPRLEHAQIEDWQKEGASVLVLDEVGNANNLGAIIRSAAFFGIENLVLTEEDKQAAITTSVYRVAQGGMEFVNLFRVSSTAWFLRQCRGKITCIGTDLQAYHDISGMHRLLEKNEPCAVVLGNEERGISSETKKLCNHLVKIHGSGNIESLNVAQAATLFCSILKSKPE